MMDAERAGRLEQLYQSALEHDESERRAFLENACGADLELRREIESLLALDLEAGSFIEAPALEVAARLMAQRQSSDSSARLAPPALLTTATFVPSTTSARRRGEPSLPLST